MVFDENALITDVFGLPRKEIFIYGGLQQVRFTTQQVFDVTEYCVENNIKENFETQSEILAYFLNLQVPDPLPKTLYTT